MISEPERHRESVKFLERDFVECFAEKRRYEEVSWDVCKFAFTVTMGVVTLSLGAYQFSIERDINLIPVGEALLGLGLLIGVFFLLLLVRNRVYFVVVTRYINSHREFFLASKPLGFSNATGFFADSKQPPYFSWQSTQTWATYVVAALNSAMAASLTTICFARNQSVWKLDAAVFVGIFAFQAMAVRLYLVSRETRTDAGSVVFGTGKR